MEQIIYRVYFTDEDGRTSSQDYTNKEEAIRMAKWHYKAWGRPDEDVEVVKITMSTIDFKGE